MSSAGRSFFVAGGALPSDAISYIQREADERLFASLVAGEFCFVLTSRQMGKSSLMVRTAVRLQELGTRVAAVDLTAFGQNLEVHQWYKGIIARIGRQLRIEDEVEDYWDRHNDLPPLERWLATLQNTVLPNAISPVVVFIDEIDMVKSLPFPTDEFFAGIRSCYGRRPSEKEFERLTFCLLGVAAPSDLIQDIHVTPFNIGRRIQLDDFRRAEADPLGVGISVTGRSGSELLDRVLYWTGGHPYLTQRLCESVSLTEAAHSARDVDALCHRMFLSREALQSESNLAFVSNRILKSGADVAELLGLYRAVYRSRAGIEDDTRNPLFVALRLSGLVKANQGRLTVRNRIYRQVFDNRWMAGNMPGVDLRRQRAAFTRGALRVGLLSAMVVGVTGFLLWKTQQQVLREEVVGRELRHMLYVADLNGAGQALRLHNPTRSQELLLMHRAEGKHSFAWSYLWRAGDAATHTLTGHRGFVYSVGFSPDGRSIVSGGADGTIRVWDAAAGVERFKCQLSSRPVVTAVFAARGSLIVTGSWDGSIGIFAAADGSRLADLPRSVSVLNAMAVSPDGKTVAAAGDRDSITLYKLGAGFTTEIKTLRQARVGALAISAEGDRLAIGDGTGRVTVRGIPSEEVLFSVQGHAGTANSLAFAPGGNVLASGGQDGKVILWNVAARSILLPLPQMNQGVRAVAFSGDGRRIAAGGEDNVIRVWNAKTGEQTQAFEGHRYTVTAVAFAPSGSGIASASRDDTVKVWDLRPRDQVVLRGAGHDAKQSAFSRSGNRLARVSNDDVLEIWDTSTGRLVKKLDKFGRNLSQIAFAANDEQLIVDVISQGTKVFDLRTGKVQQTLARIAYPSYFLGVSPDLRWVAVGTADNRLELWDRGRADKRIVFSGHTRRILSMAYSQDETQIATGGSDGVAIVWNQRSRLPERIFRGHRRGVTAVAFSPDGSTLATASDDRTVRLWDRRTGREILMLEPSTGPVNSLSFSADGDTLICAGEDSIVRFLRGGAAP